MKGDKEYIANYSIQYNSYCVFERVNCYSTTLYQKGYLTKAAALSDAKYLNGGDGK